jgi:hypothetical protein
LACSKVAPKKPTETSGLLTLGLHLQDEKKQLDRTIQVQATSEVLETTNGSLKTLELAALSAKRRAEMRKRIAAIPSAFVRL